MAEFNDFDIEVQDKKDSDSEHINGSVTTAGVPVPVTASGGVQIQNALIINQSKGPNKNASNTTYLLVNTDGGSDYTTVPRGGSLSVKGPYSTISIDSNTNGAKYEVILHKSST